MLLHLDDSTHLETKNPPVLNVDSTLIFPLRNEESSHSKHYFNLDNSAHLEMRNPYMLNVDSSWEFDRF